ncbi:MAG: hypothetical protein WCF47_01970 [Pseudolabrys sp.]
MGPSFNEKSPLQEKSGFSSSLPPVRQLYHANFPPTQAAEMLCRLRFFQVFPLCKDRHSQCGFWGAARNRKRKNRMVAATDGVARKSATDVNQLVQAEPREGFVRFMDALRETRRRQARREIAKNAHLLSDDFWRQLDLWRNLS